MSVQRAERDLEVLVSRERELRTQLSEVCERADKIRAYIEMAKVYSDTERSGANLPAKTKQDTPNKGGRPPGQSKSAQMVDIAVNIIQESGKPMHTKDIMEKLRELGVLVNGKEPMSNLSGKLSRSEKLIGDRALGWSLAEWHQSSYEIAKPPFWQS